MLQRHTYSAGIRRRARSAACESHDIGYDRVSSNNVYKARNPLPHRLEGRILNTLNASGDAPGILLRKKSFKHNDEEIDIHADGEQENTQGEGRVPQDPCEAALVDTQHPKESFLASPIESAVIFLSLVLEKPGAHHGSGGQ